MEELTSDYKTYTTLEDQFLWFWGKIGETFNVVTNVSGRNELKQGTYRVINSELYQIKQELPPSLIGDK